MSAPRRKRAAISRATAARVSEMVGVLADPSRVVLLEALSTGERSVQALADELDMPRRNVSHHLGILRGAGFVTARREATSNLHSIEDWSVWWLLERAIEAVLESD